MTQALTTQQIGQYIPEIQNGGVEQARQVYDTLNAQDYNYAGWAAGVARGDSITRLSALSYLEGTALMGLGGDACRNLTQAQTDKIRVDMASAGTSASLQLASNGFYREFTDTPVLTQQAQALPQMQGSGWVRDLQEAMSVGGVQVEALQASVAAFTAGTTHDSQLVVVDQLLAEWAASCACKSSTKSRFDAQKRISRQRKPTRSADWMSAASRNLRLAFDARAA